ncbi:DEAD/DEAH box helicase family protein [Microbacterium sp. LRZ72]|uniref:type I restriction endonuclease subunit R n=1 Tax=Microbacterium sp. LRZ72 TaxID=2942481 RepID=UPI0029ACABB0|nr:DEAD/DEAH box helicase family protein [Microbacterium sp. LRZ72]MDX2377765.1 DEAD/DEAH box helicase family protein [Microbacterium sp. LRZ72]
MPVDDRLPAEARARKLIDEQLEAAGWFVHDRKDLNLFVGPGVAVREVIMAAGHGRVDYLLYVDKKVVGVIEAKPVGTTLSGVEWQSAMYATGLPGTHAKRAITIDGRLPFVFEASGTETHFTNGYDASPRARRIFAFPQPATLARQVREATETPDAPTWRARVRGMPELDRSSLRPAQIDAVEGVERSLREQRFSRSLIQMATGAGKTYTAVTEAYRLLTYGGFGRVLFLVDRNNLADQTLAEFQNYRTPGDGRRFTELYPVAKLSSAGMLASSSVVISTIQRVHRVLQGKEADGRDDQGIDDFVPDAPVSVSYNPAMPPEAFDLVLVDEAHRSIYGVWRGVLEYFDAHIVGLTATPGKQTFGFFQQNLVSEYTYPESVADGVNVDFGVYRIKTRVSEEGGLIEAGTIVPKVDRRTRAQRLEALDEDLEYAASQLDRAVTNVSQLRTILETYRDRMPEIFPGRRVVPKTLIFCKDDNHAETVVTLVREVFGKGNDFAAKITYNAKDPKGHLQAFRTSPTLRVAVTVDMIATGTDVKPLECVFFLRDVRSAQYFEQMKGRGARTIASADFQSVTPDAADKTRFVIVDAVGVTEHDFVEPPLNRDRGISLQKLLAKVADLSITEDETATLASRLSALELQLTASERAELDEVAGGSLRDVIRGIVDAVDSDTQAAVLAAVPGAGREAALAALIESAITPLAANADLRARILELRRAHHQVIDEVTVDELVDAFGVVDTSRARSIVESWREYLREHRSEISAIQVLMEAKTHRVPFASIEELAERIKRPPHNWTVDLIWNAYAAVQVERVKPNSHARLTDLVSLLRFELGEDNDLVPYADLIRTRYDDWLGRQALIGTVFTGPQRWWLDRMADVIANSAGLTDADLELAPFSERGGPEGAVRDLGAGAGALIESLNAELTA